MSADEIIVLARAAIKAAKEFGAALEVEKNVYRNKVREYSRTHPNDNTPWSHGLTDDEKDRFATLSDQLKEVKRTFDDTEAFLLSLMTETPGSPPSTPAAPR